MNDSYAFGMYKHLLRIAFPERAMAHSRHSREWKRRNPDKVKAARRRWGHSENGQKSRHLWYLRNRDSVLSRVAKWAKDNPDRVNARAALKRCKFSALDKDERARVARVYRSAVTWRRMGFNVVVDHIKPLSKGGSHTANNLQIIYYEENARKAAREDYFPSVIFHETNPSQ